jgi:hypothetical protein
VTAPAVPFAAYASTLLENLPVVVAAVLPYVAAFTVFAIGIRLIRRWLGMRSASSLAMPDNAAGSGRGWKPCNYDCWDNGGCDRCSTWHEWDDADYGRVGEYRSRRR